MILRKTRLYFCEGSSNKEYIATIVLEGRSYRVLCYYGRVGYSLKEADKGTFSTPSSAAIAFEKVVNEKRMKGYVVDYDRAEAEPDFTFGPAPVVVSEKEEVVETADCRTSSEDERAKALARLKAACAN